MRIEPIKPFFCNKVLPVTYSNSLSYYELLEKLCYSLNLTIENVKELGASFEQLYNWVNNYFANLDVQEEIDNKLDELIANGTFGQYLYRIIGFVTPTMYGAVGDGVADDTQAFKDALETGKNVKVLEGFYKITDSLRATDQRVECLPYAVINAEKAIELYNSEWYGGIITNGYTTGFMLADGICKLDSVDLTVSHNGSNGVSWIDGHGEIVNCKINGLETAYMGIWADAHEGLNNQYVLQIHNCEIKNFQLNGIFTSAKCADIAYNLLDNNHIQTEPNGGGQIDVVGKQTQGYQIVRSNIIQNGGGYRTSGIELDWSANAEIFGNVINVADSMLYGVVLQNASHGNVHDNTIIGTTYGTGIGVNSGTSTDVKNVLRTHNNWFAGVSVNVAMNSAISVVSLDEQRYEGDLVTYGGYAESVQPIIDVNNGYIVEVSLEQNASVSLKVNDVHNLKFMIHRTVAVEDQPLSYITDVLVDADNDIIATSSQSPDFTFSGDVLTYTNGTLGQTVLVKVMVLN